MTTEPDPRLDRDRAVRRAGRLRRTLVGSSAAASLALAAVLGVSAAQSSTGTAASDSNTSTGSTNTGSNGTTLSSGSGTSNATTSGS